MYFDGDPYNAEDPFLNSAEHKELLIAEMLAPPKEFEPDSKAIVFDIVLYNG
jgi:protocatechuate 3,4-dioxygenase beta subunit